MTIERGLVVFEYSTNKKNQRLVSTYWDWFFFQLWLINKPITFIFVYKKWAWLKLRSFVWIIGIAFSISSLILIALDSIFWVLICLLITIIFLLLLNIFKKNAFLDIFTVVSTSTPQNEAELQLYRVLQRASLLAYYDTLLEMGKIHVRSHLIFSLPN